MQEMADADLSDATGEGIAIVLNDFALKFGPTSYFELTGADEAVGVNELGGAGLVNRRGDLRWYGRHGAAHAPTGFLIWVAHWVAILQAWPLTITR